MTFLKYYIGSINHSANFHPVSSTACVCPGDVLLYECTIEGAGTTVWRGSAFMTCDYIALLHSQFTPGTGGTCNRGALIASSLRTENGSRYTSQLNVTISRELDQTSVECVHDNGSRLLTVGASKVQLKGRLTPCSTKSLNFQIPQINSHIKIIVSTQSLTYFIHSK